MIFFASSLITVLFLITACGDLNTASNFTPTKAKLDKYEALEIYDFESAVPNFPKDALSKIPSDVEKLNKAKVDEGKNPSEKRKAREDRKDKYHPHSAKDKATGVHAPAEHLAGPGDSQSGNYARWGKERSEKTKRLTAKGKFYRDEARKGHKFKLDESKKMAKPKLPK